ncbi:MAG: PAC2 family protein [Anaerolineales bacterium]|nr:MAG: PAC2 family protein [Anaerolineales bacterium]
MDYLELDELPTLRRPMFIAAFRGWNDAGEAATLALRQLIENWSAQRFASIDPEEFFDFTVARPMISVTEEGLRDLKWPRNRFFYSSREDADTDVVLLLGTEPHLKWRAFTETVRDLYQRLDGSRLVTVGALVAATTHTRPPPVTGFATEDDLQRQMEGLTVTRTRYEGPTGIVGTIHDAWRCADLPAASLWAGLPAYLGNTVNPTAALALLEALDRLFAFGLDLTQLAETSRRFTKEIDQALASNEEMKAYLSDLEQSIDAGISEGGMSDLPPSGEIISDLEDFLRRQRGDG